MATLFESLKNIDQKPKPFEFYTTPELWCDPYISKQMLAFHLNQNTELASRNNGFIERSVDWIFNHFKVNASSRICDLGCGPGLYTTKMAKKGAAVTGVDFSQHSIQYAITQAKQNHLEISYRVDDYLKFETNEPFDLMTLIYCDFCVLSSHQRKVLLQKIHQGLKEKSFLLFDVHSFAHYDAKQEERTFEYSGKEGFWSPDPYYEFHHVFKYEPNHLLLDKFTIVEASRTRENYNWFQCYNVETISNLLQENGFRVVDCFSNVVGDPYHEKATEIAVVAQKIG